MLIAGDELRSEQIALWRSIQRSNPDLDNPCFAPEFVHAVAVARGDVEVAVLHENNAIVGFFPFQRKSWHRAVPVGGIVSDYHGIICRPGFQLDPRELLKACNLVAWDFDRLVSSQVFFAPFCRLSEPSAQIDLADGYEAFAAERRRAGTHQLRDCEYVTRCLERDLGPVRFVAHSPNPGLLTQVLAWKSEQYRRSGWNDLFATRWARDLVERIHATQKADFAGMLSLLYAGPVLVAGHLGMRSRATWHYWFPAYDRRFARYSPGLILLLHMARSAEDFGLRCIDLGTGLSLYKKRLMNASVDVAEGSVERPSLLRAIRSTRRSLGALLKRCRRVASLKPLGWD